MKTIVSRPNPDNITFPITAVAYKGGVSCRMKDGLPIRIDINNKHMVNSYLNSVLSGLHGLEGEIVVHGNEQNLYEKDKPINFTFYVYDTIYKTLPYTERLHDLTYDWDINNTEPEDCICIPENKELNNIDELNKFLIEMLNKGGNIGIMLIE